MDTNVTTVQARYLQSLISNPERAYATGNTIKALQSRKLVELVPAAGHLKVRITEAGREAATGASA